MARSQSKGAPAKARGNKRGQFAGVGQGGQHKPNQQPKPNAQGKGGNRGKGPNTKPSSKSGTPRGGRQGQLSTRGPQAQAQSSPIRSNQIQPSSPLGNLPSGAHLIPGRQPVVEALKANRPISAVFIERGLNLTPIPELAKERGVTLAFAGRDEMEVATGGVLHQGVVAVAKTALEPDLNDHLHHDLVVIADGITDARNLGAIARSAEQAGAGCLIVRARRAASTSPAAEKAAAGAFSWLPVITVSNITHAVNALKAAGMWAVALDSGQDAHNIHQLNLMDERVALIVGEEGAGVSRVVRNAADAVAEIPMVGHLDSLNASVATGVALFEWVRRHPREGMTPNR